MALAAFAATALAALNAGPSPAASPFDPLDPLDPPLAYCDGSPGGALGELTTDREHRRIVPEQPLPPNVRARALRAGRMHTVVLEAGPRDAAEAVVFVHGNPGSGTDWIDLLSAAGRFGRAIALDMPGFGGAGDFAGYPYTVDGAAAFLDHALRKLGVRRAHLVLHDFGGPFGLAWAANHPERVQSAVLFDTGILVDYLGHPAAHVWRTPLVGELNMATTNRKLFHGSIQSQTPRPLPERFVDRMYDDFDRPTRCAVLSYYRDMDDPGALGRAQAAALRPRDIPALVIWGRSDPYLPARLAYRQREAFPSAEIHIFEESGHWPFIDAAHRARRLVIPFLRRALG